MSHEVSAHVQPKLKNQLATQTEKEHKSVIRAQLEFSGPHFYEPVKFVINRENDIFEQIVGVEKRQPTHTVFVF